jgi:signal transduction histidine kinase
MDAVQPMTEVRRQTITTDIQSTIPPLWIDVDMVRRVLVNLFENASKYSLPEGKLSIGASQEGDWAKIWVQDDGPGIAQTDQDRIFEKYTRLKSGESSSGLGVGLAFCRLAVLAHGGQIWVESESGHGSTFFLTLPLAKEHPHT